MKSLKIISAICIFCAFVTTSFADDEYFKFYLIGGSGKIGLRNTANDCKIAVINFTYTNGKHELKEFKVPGKSSIDVDIKGTTMTEIIDHKDCKN